MVTLRREVVSRHMDRTMLEQHLALNDEHIVLCKYCVGRQRELIAEQERDGQDTAGAIGLLIDSEELLGAHYAGRKRLLHQLAQKDYGAATVPNIGSVLLQVANVAEESAHDPEFHTTRPQNRA